MKKTTTSVILVLLSVAVTLCAGASEDDHLAYLEYCKPMELDFIVLEGEATLRAIEDDIAEDLAKVGITVNPRFLPRDEFNEAMVSGDFNMAFSESWGMTTPMRREHCVSSRRN